MFSRKEKILVEVIGARGVKKKRCVLDGNKVIIKQGKGVRGDPSIKAEFDKDCILPYCVGIGFFKRWKQKLVWIEGHKKCINFKGKVSLSYMDVKGYFNAGAIKNSGSTIQTIKIPAVLYILFAGVIFLQVLSFLVSTGRVRFG